MRINNKKKIFHSFFIGNLITLIIPIVLIATLIYFTLYSYFNNNMAQKDNVIALTMKKNIESFLNEAVDTLEYINLNAENQEITNVNQMIDQINSVNNYFENIEIIDHYGKVKYTLSANARQINYNRSGEIYFKYIQDNNRIYWSQPFISPVNGKATLIIAIPEGNTIVVGYLNLDYLNNLTNSSIQELGEGLEVAIVDSYGVYVSENDPAMVQQRQLEPNFDRIKKQETDHIHLDYDDKEYMVVAKEIKAPNWYLIIYDDYELNFSTVSMLLKLFVGLFILSIINAIAISSIRAYRISKYVSEFIKTTETIASGDFKVSFDDQNFEEFDRLAACFKAMTESLKSRDAELENLAFHDKLTGLYNRAYLYAQSQWKKGNYSTAEIIGLIYLDIDNFKITNDTYGHTVGDELLIKLSKRIKNCVDDEIVFLRLGGDEFVLLIPDDVYRHNLKKTIENIRNSLKESIYLEDRNIFITVSMGISIAFNKGQYNINTQLRNADTAMYVAKEQGKNTFAYYSSTMNDKIERRMQIEQNLRNGLENEEFYLVYQPLIIAEKRSITGFEALLRWNNDVLGFIRTEDFISVAEETGIINKLGEWVLRNACLMIKSMNERYDSNYTVAVNVSPVELQNRLFIDNLNKIISETGIKPQWLEIEITENVFIENAAVIIKTLNLIRERGIRLSLDDFGTGYSSLSYLKKLPINTLKIDREFIKDLEFEKDSVKMVESIVLMAHSLGADVIAEGVETEAQVNQLESISCDKFQGYFFSKPIEFSGIIESMGFALNESDQNDKALS